MSCSMTSTERSRGDRQQQLAGARGLLVVRPATGSSTSSSSGSWAMHHADLQPLLLAVRQRAGQLAALRRGRRWPASPRCARARRRRRGRAAWPARPCSAAAATARRSPTRVRFTNTDGVWNLRPMPRAAIWFSLRAVRSVLRPKITRPCSGLHPARDHVEQRRLAGAVGPDHHAQLAPVHEEVQAVERLEALVGDGDVLEVDDRVAHVCIGAACTARTEGGAVPGAARRGLLADRRRRRWARRAERADDAVGDEEHDAHEEGAEEEQPQRRDSSWSARTGSS